MNQKEHQAPFARSREDREDREDRADRAVHRRAEPPAQPPLLDMGGQGPALCFAHANGYPPQSYRPLFDVLGTRFHIGAVEHRPLWGGPEPPGRVHWRVFAEDLSTALARHYARPVWVLGHSMGATAAALAAARSPALFAGLVLLDPVLLPRRLVWGMRLLPWRALRRLPMIRKALARPRHFRDHREAFDFYRGKRAFRHFSDAALMHYVRASKTAQGPGGVQLRYPGSWEAAVYASPPWMRGALRRLRLPTLGLRGAASDTLSQAMFARWQRWQPSALLRETPGGHLFPLEHPEQTGRLILESVAAYTRA